MTDLDKLIEAVESGDWSGSWRSVIDAGIDAPRLNGAYHGSLDAAKALHEALLTGYKWDIQGPTGHASVWGTDSDGAHTDPNNPARAWLIATLKAYRSLQ